MVRSLMGGGPTCSSAHPPALSSELRGKLAVVFGFPVRGTGVPILARCLLILHMPKAGMFLILCTFVCTSLRPMLLLAFLRIPSVGIAAWFAIASVGSVPPSFWRTDMSIMSMPLLDSTLNLGVNVHSSHSSHSFMMTMMMDLLREVLGVSVVSMLPGPTVGTVCLLLTISISLMVILLKESFI